MKGTYLLEVLIKAPCRIKVGALGSVRFEKGKYVYVGSAMNSLEKRIERHFREKKKKFWHIDYLLARKHVELKRAFFTESHKKMECRIARALAKKYPAVKGFGCSDCKCDSHLFKAKINSHEFNLRK